jgi:hypothetical protein
MELGAVVDSKELVQLTPAFTILGENAWISELK